MRSIVILLPLCCSLSACWASQSSFYTPDPKAPQPFSNGLWADVKSPAESARMTRLPDGRWLVEPKNGGGPMKPSPLTFAPVPAGARKVWIAQVPFDLPQFHAAAYELGEARRDGTVNFSELKCAGSEALTKGAGGTVKVDKNFNNGQPSCTFTTRASLEKAVGAYLKGHDPLPESSVARRTGN